MIDNCNRVIDYIRISVTDRCNLRCVYCMPEKGVEFIPHKDIISYEEIIRLCRLFASLGVSKVKLTGGEPLVRKNLPYLVKEIKNIQGINNVTLTTNGVLLSEQIKDLAEAGIDSINVSLDTLDPVQFEKLTRFHKLETVLEGIRETLKYKNISLKINSVPLKDEENRNSILPLVSLAKEERVHVRFIEVMPIGLGKDLKGISEDEIKGTIEKEHGALTPYEGQLGNGPCRYYGLEGFAGKIGFISSISHGFCASCNRVRLTSEGYLKNCLQYSSGVDLKKVMRDGVSDEELTRIIKDSIAKKPKEHNFKEIIKKQEDSNLSNQKGIIKEHEEVDDRKMSQIGG